MIRKGDFKPEQFPDMYGNKQTMFARRVSISSGDFFRVRFRQGLDAVLFCKRAEIIHPDVESISAHVVCDYYAGHEEPKVSKRYAKKRVGDILWFDESANVVTVLTEVFPDRFEFKPMPLHYPRLFLNDATKMFEKQWVHPNEIKLYVPDWDTPLPDPDDNDPANYLADAPKKEMDFEKFLDKIADE